MMRNDILLLYATPSLYNDSPLLSYINFVTSILFEIKINPDKTSGELTGYVRWTNKLFTLLASINKLIL